MNIDDLGPGRELDAEVAEKVMGWKRISPRKPIEGRGMAWLLPGAEGTSMSRLEVYDDSTAI